MFKDFVKVIFLVISRILNWKKVVFKKMNIFCFYVNYDFGCMILKLKCKFDIKIM